MPCHLTSVLELEWRDFKIYSRANHNSFPPSLPASLPSSLLSPPLLSRMEFQLLAPRTLAFQSLPSLSLLSASRILSWANELVELIRGSPQSPVILYPQWGLEHFTGRIDRAKTPWGIWRGKAAAVSTLGWQTISGRLLPSPHHHPIQVSSMSREWNICQSLMPNYCGLGWRACGRKRLTSLP